MTRPIPAPEIENLIRTEAKVRVDHGKVAVSDGS